VLYLLYIIVLGDSNVGGASNVGEPAVMWVEPVMWMMLLS